MYATLSYLSVATNMTRIVKVAELDCKYTIRNLYGNKGMPYKSIRDNICSLARSDSTDSLDSASALRKAKTPCRGASYSSAIFGNSGA